MKVTLSNACFTASLLLGAFLLSACEGDSNPFEESVEVETLGLTGLVIKPPANAQAEIFINPGQSMQLTLMGNSSVGNNVELSGAGRNWSSSNPSALNVSENGVVTGVSTSTELATAQVSVLIGGIRAAPFQISVRNADLVAINEIAGSATLRRCVPDDFYATGEFSDGTTRTLYDASFTLPSDSGAALLESAPATARVNATRVTSDLTLTARVGDTASLGRQLAVLNTLAAITITPDPTSVDEDESKAFVATGTYTANGEIEEPDTTGAAEPPPSPGGSSNDGTIITETVEWKVTSGTEFASVSNDGANSGQLLGISEGTAVLQASCGDKQSSLVNVVINDVTASDSDQLSFDIDRSDNVLIIGVNETEQLEVSRGSEFNEDDLVTDEVSFAFFNLDGNTVEVIDQTAILTGGVRGLQAGGRVRVTATLLDSDGTIEASGSIIIEVR